MNAAEFEAALRDAGYQEIATRTLAPKPANDAHTHDAAVRGLVTAGEFIITRDGVAQSFKPGDVFEVAAGVRHSEAVGPDGTCITAGRLYR